MHGSKNLFSHIESIVQILSDSKSSNNVIFSLLIILGDIRWYFFDTPYNILRDKKK